MMISAPVVARIVFAAGLLSLAGCGSNSPVGPNGRVPYAESGGVIGTGPVFDWEQVPTPAPAKPNRVRDSKGGSTAWERQALNDLRLLRFSSAKTLAETTAWLKRVMEQYGKVTPEDDASTFELRDIRFQGCAMQWTLRESFDGGMIEHLISLNLGDLDLRPEHPGTRGVEVNGANDGTLLYTVGEKIRVTERITDGSELKPERTFPVAMIGLNFRRADFIKIRTAYAFVHAARRCGAKAPAAN